MRTLPLVLLVVLTGPALAWARQAPSPAAAEGVLAQDLKRLTIEELAELDVTSVSRRSERLAQTAAAISVVRYEDIRRVGAWTLAEAMRLADALDVARFDGRTWNITARGFNIVTANKLLVLMDGRTLYSPLFAGTFWDIQDPVLADIDRIEVIRGPGGTIWGANAVNGVINIISKEAADTRGGHLLLSSGSESHVTAAARYGDRTRGGGSYRISGKYRRQGANVFASGEPSADPLQLGQFGVRIDSSPRRAWRWSLQGNAYRGTEALFDRDDTAVAGGYAQARLVRELSAGSELQVGTYYDYTFRDVPLQFLERRHTVEVDVHHRLRIGTRHDVVYGGHMRATTSRDVGRTFTLDPERRTNSLAGVFVQDEVRVGPQVFLTLGSKFEGNDYTGLEVQPTARIRWSPHDRQTVWGAVSRAVRLPARFDDDLRIPARPPTPAIAGSDAFLAETVVAVEGGYRLRPHPRLSFDVAAFANRYDRIRSQEFPSRLGAVVELGNTLDADSNGIEVAGTVQALERWRVHGAFTYLDTEIARVPGSRDISGGVNEANDPPYYFTLRSYLDLPAGFAVDAFFRRVAERPAPLVPSYSSLNLRFGWIPRPGWELSLVGHDLLDSSHPEFGAPVARRYEFERGVFVRSIWSF
jgi:iron complex outermembrane receptor protein